MDRGSNFINWSHPEKIETKAHCWGTCSKKTSEWHNHLIISYICSYNKYFYVSCQFRLTSCPSVLGLRGSPHVRLTVLKQRKSQTNWLVTLFVIKHGALRGRQMRKLVEKSTYGSQDIWGFVLCSWLAIGSYLRSSLAPLTLRSMK